MVEPQPPRSFSRRLISAVLGWLQAGVITTALLLPLCIVWKGRVIKSSIQTLLSLRETEEAEKLMEEYPTHPEALRLLLQAQKRTPEEPQVIRLMARFCAQTGLPHYARYFYLQLERLGAAETQDRLQLSAALAGLSDPTGARIILEQIEASEGSNIESHRAHARIAAAAGDVERMQAALQKVIALDPEDDAALLSQAAALTASADAEKQRQGITTLLGLLAKNLVSTEADFRQQCFWQLACADFHDDALRGRFALLVDRMPWQSLERRITQILLGMPAQRGAAQDALLAAQVRDAFRQHARADAQDRLLAARLLQRHDQHLLVLECISFELSLQSAELCAVRFDSLMAARLWQQAEQTVNHPGVPLARHAQALMHAYHALATQGDNSVGIRKLGEALEAARDVWHQGTFIAIGRLAEEHKLHRMAAEAYAEAFHPRYPVATHLLPDLLRSARLGGMDAVTVLRHVEAREKAEPWNIHLQRESTYLRLLCGDQLERLFVETSQKLAREPADMQNAFFHAFASLRLQQNAAALSTLGHLTQPHAWQPHEKAAMSMILASTGETALSSRLRATIPADACLFPEERRLLSSYP